MNPRRAPNSARTTFTTQNRGVGHGSCSESVCLPSTRIASRSLDRPADAKPRAHSGIASGGWLAVPSALTTNE